MHCVYIYIYVCTVYIHIYIHIIDDTSSWLAGTDIRVSQSHGARQRTAYLIRSKASLLRLNVQSLGSTSLQGFKSLKKIVILQCFCFFLTTWGDFQIPRNLPFQRRLQAGLSCCRVDWAGAGYICGRPKWRRVSSEASIRAMWRWEDGRGLDIQKEWWEYADLTWFNHVFLVKIAHTNLV